MRKLIIALLLLGTTAVNAQTVKETFDSNTLGWTEISEDSGEAVIKDGIMHLEGNGSWGTSRWGFSQPIKIETHCYASLDVSKNFDIKFDAVAGRTKKGYIGVMLDYIDSGNFIAFVFDSNSAFLLRYREGKLIGSIPNYFKMADKKDTKLSVLIKSTYQKLQFYINNMLAIEARYLPLTSNGFGFFVWGIQQVDFDNVEFIQ